MVDDWTKNVAAKNLLTNEWTRTSDTRIIITPSMLRRFSIWAEYEYLCHLADMRIPFLVSDR